MLVCEGYAEDAFARVIRDLYLPRDCGVVLQRKNARGYGGAKALEIAAQLKAEGAYHEFGVLVDNDAHWGAAERTKANEAGIYVIENSPCIEATLLQIGGHKVPANTKQCKSAFEEKYGGPADREGLIARSFTRDDFEAARRSVLALQRLLEFIGK